MDSFALLSLPLKLQIFGMPHLSMPCSSSKIRFFITSWKGSLATTKICSANLFSKTLQKSVGAGAVTFWLTCGAIQKQLRENYENKFR